MKKGLISLLLIISIICLYLIYENIFQKKEILNNDKISSNIIRTKEGYIDSVTITINTKNVSQSNINAFTEGFIDIYKEKMFKNCIKIKNTKKDLNMKFKIQDHEENIFTKFNINKNTCK